MLGWLRRMLGRESAEPLAPFAFEPAVPDPMMSLGFTEQFLQIRRAQYVGEDANFVLANIDCGILFFMAFWSGPARAAFAELKRVLADIDPTGRIELVVIDLDGCTQMPNVPGLNIAMLSGGYGETAWVRNGRIISTTGREFHPECFLDNTRALLEQCSCA